MRGSESLYPQQLGYGAEVDIAPMPSGSREAVSCGVSFPTQPAGIGGIARPAQPRWYCCGTRSQQEHRALGELLAQGFNGYLPLHLDRSRDADRIVPLFPGYLFVEFDVDGDEWGPIQHTRGVWSLLLTVCRKPAPIPVGVVEDLIARTSARRVVDDPGTSRRHRYMPLGSRQKVVEGPLAGWEGVCTMSSQNRCRLLLGLFGGDREVEFKMSSVQAA